MKTNLNPSQRARYIPRFLASGYPRMIDPSTLQKTPAASVELKLSTRIPIHRGMNKRTYSTASSSKQHRPSQTSNLVLVQSHCVRNETDRSKGEGPSHSEPVAEGCADETEDDHQTEDECVAGVDEVWQLSSSGSGRTGER